MFEPIDTKQLFDETKFKLQPDMLICQVDYPIDWYQPEFIPYAESFQALPDRKFETIIDWMTPYINKAKTHFGDALLLLAHYYMGGEIVKLIEHFGGYVGDSYQLALQAQRHPQKKVIVESAVHFMAESIAMLANTDQKVYITNPKSGCTMEMLAKDYMVSPAIDTLNDRYGRENILPLCYMNTSGRVKAMCGAQGGAVCTSSNVLKIARWAMTKNKKILFIPDKFMGENVAYWLGIQNANIAYWPGGSESVQFDLNALAHQELQRFDQAKIILFESYCAVHAVYTPSMVDHWSNQGYTTLAHPECKNIVVREVDGTGSTAYLFDTVVNDRFKTGKYAIATENHMVQNLKSITSSKNIDVVNMAEIPSQAGQPANMGCGCATMSRNDPPHLVATLDLLCRGENLSTNLVKAGDVVDELTGSRDRLSTNDQRWIVTHARKALERMIDITEDRL